MVNRNSMMLSRRADVLSADGIGLGVLVHVGDTILGGGLLIQHCAGARGPVRHRGDVLLGRQRLLAMRHWIDRVFGRMRLTFGVLLAFARAAR